MENKKKLLIKKKQHYFFVLFASLFSHRLARNIILFCQKVQKNSCKNTFCSKGQSESQKKDGKVSYVVSRPISRIGYTVFGSQVS